MSEVKISRLVSLMETHKLEALILNPGPTLTYLTGLQFHLMERPVLLIIVPSHKPVLILPALEANKASMLSDIIDCVPYEDDPMVWQNIIQQTCQELKIDGCSVGIEPIKMRVLEYRYLETAAPQATFLSAETVISDLRIQKSAAEIEKMRQAVNIAEKAVLTLIASIRPGMTEHEMASELTVQMLREGADSDIPFAPIVASGPNTANPHAVPGNRAIRPGDLLLIDWGASYEGYLSDITRTFIFQTRDTEFENIARIVIDANAAGRSAACLHGRSAASIDQQTRKVITDAGYGEYFTHRTGHGLGMEPHEPPFIHGNNQMILMPGMVFTVEPGIYLPGKGGVRFEDDVVITENGAETLTTLPRDLKVIG